MNIHYRKKLTYAIIFFLSSTLLTSCQGNSKKPSLETVQLSDKEAQNAYEGLREDLDMMLANPYAYIASAMNIHGGDKFFFYQTEAYQTACVEWHSNDNQPKEKYFWYDGSLYRYDASPVNGKAIDWNWRATDWKELAAEEFVESVLDCGFNILQEEPEQLEYFEYPTSEKNRFRLSIKYPLLNVDMETEPVSASIIAWWDNAGNLNSFYVLWSRSGNDNNGDMVEISVSPYEGSKDYKAEREIWEAGYNFDLCDTPVPDVNKQYTDRTWCEEMIQNMNFKELQTPETQDDELQFEIPYAQIFGLQE